MTIDPGGGEGWLATAEKLAPIGYAVVAFVFGTLVRAKVNDTQLVATVEAVSDLKETVQEQSKLMTKIQNMLENQQKEVHLLRRELRDTNRIIAANSGSIERIRGRMGDK